MSVFLIAMFVRKLWNKKSDEEEIGAWALPTFWVLEVDGYVEKLTFICCSVDSISVSDVLLFKFNISSLFKEFVA